MNVNSMHEQAKKRFVAASFEGVHAIFVERPAIVYVQVSDVLSDDWGVKFTITDSCRPGMHRLSKSACPISAAWQIFSFDDGGWQAHYVPWRVFFDLEVIRNCVARANEKAKAGEVLEYDDGQEVFAEYYMRVSHEFLKQTNSLLRAKGFE
jgi:hypothetical protein